MAQPSSHFLAQQQSQGMSNVSLQQALGQKASTLTTGTQLHQQEKTIVDDLESAFQGCIAPFLPGADNENKLVVPPDKLRMNIELSIQEFTEQARKVEAYFLKKHATVAQQQPELILQEEIEELREEITRKDATIQSHSNKVRQWQESLRQLQISLNERMNGPPTTPNLGLQQGQTPQMHPETMPQQTGQRR